jgi:hypothetical protein
VDVVTAVVVTVKVCVVAPAGTVTLVGTLATVLLELERVTTAPPVPAGDVRVTVPVPDWPPTTVLGVTAILLRAAGSGLIVKANVLLTPASEAVRVTGVELVTVPAVTVKVADVAPCGITTLAGTLAAEVTELERNTVMPSTPAAAVAVTVPVPV